MCRSQAKGAWGKLGLMLLLAAAFQHVTHVTKLVKWLYLTLTVNPVWSKQRSKPSGKKLTARIPIQSSSARAKRKSIFLLWNAQPRKVVWALFLAGLNNKKKKQNEKKWRNKTESLDAIWRGIGRGKCFFNLLLALNQRWVMVTDSLWERAWWTTVEIFRKCSQVYIYLIRWLAHRFSFCFVDADFSNVKQSTNANSLGIRGSKNWKRWK